MGPSRKFRSAFEQLSRAVFTSTCMVCQRKAAVLCSACRSALVPNLLRRCQRCFSPEPHNPCSECVKVSGSISVVRYLFDYDDRIQSLITTMKYRPSYGLYKIASEIMAESAPKLFNRHDLVIPIPISKTGYKKRGFNQCSVMARAIGHRLDTRVSGGSLRHRGYRSPQASLPAQARWKNVQSAFRADAKLVRGKRILLIDDVITTGATTSAAAQELLRAGAHTVNVYAFCHGGREKISNILENNVPFRA